MNILPKAAIYAFVLCLFLAFDSTWAICGDCPGHTSTTTPSEPLHKVPDRPPDAKNKPSDIGESPYDGQYFKIDTPDPTAPFKTIWLGDKQYIILIDKYGNKVFREHDEYMQERIDAEYQIEKNNEQKRRMEMGKEQMKREMEKEKKQYLEKHKELMKKIDEADKKLREAKKFKERLIEEGKGGDDLAMDIADMHIKMDAEKSEKASDDMVKASEEFDNKMRSAEEMVKKYDAEIKRLDLNTSIKENFLRKKPITPPDPNSPKPPKTPVNVEEF